MNELAAFTIAEAGRRIAAREVSCTELTEAILERIAETEPMIHAYTAIRGDAARRQATELDRELREGNWRGPLTGIPIAFKDLIYTADAPTEAGSRVLQGWVPEFDAHVLCRLRDAGAVVIGKTHTHEFAYGVNIPPTRNPWRLDCYPGGSSAGSGAAVAARSAFGAVGTDGGGSIRCPASVNGVVGLKPTTGRISRRGVVPMSSTFDNVGPMARTAEDAALMLGAMAGYDRLDPSSVDLPVPDYLESLNRGVRGMRLGIERHFFFGGLAPDVRRVAEAALDFYATQGAAIIEVSIPELEHAVAIAMPPILADTTSYHHSWIRDSQDQYEPATRVMIELGELIPATHYARAQRGRRLLRERIRVAYNANRLDGLFGPTLPMPTVPIEEVSLDLTDGSGASAGSSYFRHCVAANVTGLPAMSFPGGFSGDGLPIGLTVFGRPFQEELMFRVAHCYESVQPLHRRFPSFTAPRTADGLTGAH